MQADNTATNWGVGGTTVMQRKHPSNKQTSLGSRDADRQYSNQDGKSEEQQ